MVAKKVDDREIIVCGTLGSPFFTAVTTHFPERCDECHAEVRISDDSLLYRESHPNSRVVCIPCALPMMKAARRTHGDVEVTRVPRTQR